MMTPHEAFDELDDVIEALRRYAYDKRHERVNWRDRDEIMTKHRRLGELIRFLNGDYDEEDEA
jgi:hypothetical protein